MDPMECIYCRKDDRLAKLMVEVAPLDGATLYLFRNQSYRGRCIVAASRHVEELFELSDVERNQYAARIARVAKALKQAFGAAKINYGIYGDTMPHLHTHLVPKFPHAPGWGRPFEMNPEPGKVLTDAGNAAVIDLIRKHL